MKKAGRMEPDMPVKYLRVRYVYLGPNADTPIFGQWYDVEKVMRQALFANEDYDVLYVEFETKEAQNVGANSSSE